MCNFKWPEKYKDISSYLGGAADIIRDIKIAATESIEHVPSVQSSTSS